MATIKTVMDRAVRQCALPTVASWHSASAPRTVSDMRDHLEYTVDELLQRLDLPAPIGLDTTITGTGAESYSLPSGFKRLQRSAWSVYEKTTTRRVGVPVRTNGEWTHLKEIGSAGGARYYRIEGDDDEGYTIAFYRPLETGATVTVAYVSKYWVRGTGGAESAIWSDDTDKLLLPADVVRLGVVWRFKQQKGLPYSDILAEYEARLSRAVNDARAIRTVNFGRSETSGHPMRVPPPDLLPAG